MSRKKLTARARRVYMDYAATTPIDPEVLSVMQKAEKSIFGNASSIHTEGVMAKKVLDDARLQTARALSIHADEVVFTSGGTESNNLAIVGVINALERAGRKLSEMHIVTTAIEHSSILEPMRELERRGVSVTYVVPDERGIVSSEKVGKAMTEKTVLVSIQYANNEIGTIQPILKIAKALKDFHFTLNAKRYPLFHIDASQAPLYLDVTANRLGADLMTLDGHKMYGPKGIGMLYVRRQTPILPVMLGGGQESGLRSTTQNVPAIAAFAKALMLASLRRQKDSARLIVLRDYGIGLIRKVIPEAKINGDETERLPNNINISIPGINAEFAVLKLDVEGIACSTKSSCVSGEEMSYVVFALDKDKDRALSTLRFTFGRDTSKKDIDRLIKSLRKILS